ncbi:Putative histidine kinase [Klebsormidium nitens]|uniref:histidine kinase n=1 Tax=Klebsormidium nitens TaxID=105231 RepID=A0A1Y1IHT6_KLENI|nr:Putative histidine kinase [Klebsormidium nitens]|eukprot:GAQ90263.1 Putative histidine kinase [Klebsormidium nitens]
MAFRQDPACIGESSPSANQKPELEQTDTAELAVLRQLLRAKSDELRQAETRERAAQEKLAEETTARKEAKAQAGKKKHARQLVEAEAGAAKERLAAVARERKVREVQDRAEVATPLSVAVEQASLLEASRSAQARLLEALREAEFSARSRDEFLAVMKHEIRTPLHAIIALLSLLNQSELTEDQQSMEHTVSKSTTLLRTLINDVLDFSRLEGDSLALDPHPFHLPSLFEQLEALAGSMAQVKGVHLWIDEGIPAYVSEDDQRILQVLLNLVANSIKFTEPGGRITVKASRVEGGSSPKYLALKVTVTDTRMGIRPEDLDGKLFQKFVQADTSISRKYGGTGLGLAICKRLAEMMQGRIWLESDGVGRGCTASLVLRLQHARASRGFKSPLLESNALKGLQALVTDKNAINRLVTSRLLTSLGCEVAVAKGGRSCLEQLALQRFELVLLDLSMPDMDGFKFSRAKPSSRTRQLKISPLILSCFLEFGNRLVVSRIDINGSDRVEPEVS